MKAAVIHQFGSPEVLTYEEIDTPRPRPGHILIKVLAAGINRLDHYLREGSVVPELPFPHILGADAVGEVAELGEGVNDLKVGERVIPFPGFPLKAEEDHIRPVATAPSFAMPGLGIWGSYAEYMEVPARSVVRDDTGLRPEEVASLPVVLATSVRAVREVGGVKAGDKVLVQAGASGSGSMQIQVAKALGAKVATTVRDDAKGEYAKSLGADLVVNTRREDVVARVRDWTGGQGADVVIDNLGGGCPGKKHRRHETIGYGRRLWLRRRRSGHLRHPQPVLRAEEAGRLHGQRSRELEVGTTTRKGRSGQANAGPDAATRPSG